jgi:carbamoyltransferase
VYNEGGVKTILGIFDGTHDSGACLIQDNQLVSACDTERLTRQKGAGGFPLEAIHACVENANIRLEDIDAVAFAGLINPNPVLRISRRMQKMWTLDNGKFYAPEDRLSNWLQFSSPFPHLHPKENRHWNRSKHLLKSMLRRQILNRLDWSPPQVDLFEHHHAHAASAYYASGFSTALVITADGIGDGLALSIWLGENGQMVRKFALPYPHSLGLLYASFTGFLGYKPFRHEGKITGLAARGNPDHIDIPFPFTGDHPHRTFTERFPLYNWLERFNGHTQEDIAAWLQRGVETEILGMIRWATAEFGHHPLALAGGLFANVALNGRIASDIQPPDLFVFPNMGDGGLAAGAAYLSGATRFNWTPKTVNTMMLGPSIQTNATDIHQFVQSKPLQSNRVNSDEAISRAVRALMNDQIVARATGRLEYGPRALGNRSILANPGDLEIHSTLNTRLNRSEFMPFAPIMRAETASKWLIAPDAAWTAMQWMTITVQATPELQAKCPAVVHVDNTLRPQLIRQEDHPILWRVLEEFEAQTGLPALINTSFNRHEEPIVTTAQDALNAFWESKLDALWLNDWWIEQK